MKKHSLMKYFLVACVFSQAQTITTVAGNGEVGNSGAFCARPQHQQHKLYELAFAYKLSGFCQYFKSNYSAALDYYQKAEKIAEENQFKDILLSLHNYLGTFYKKQNRIKEALNEFRKGEILATLGNILRKPTTYSFIHKL
jgi:tetratricopeptide (TPR) repeat protein